MESSPLGPRNAASCGHRLGFVLACAAGDDLLAAQKMDALQPAFHHHFHGLGKIVGHAAEHATGKLSPLPASRKLACRRSARNAKRSGNNLAAHADSMTGKPTAAAEALLGRDVVFPTGGSADKGHVAGHARHHQPAAANFLPAVITAIVSPQAPRRPRVHAWPMGGHLPGRQSHPISSDSGADDNGLPLACQCDSGCGTGRVRM